MVQLDRELAELGGEESALALAPGQRKPHHFGEMGDGLVEIGRLEGCVSDPSHLDHGRLPCGSLSSQSVIDMAPGVKTP
jgi:hypothetical protein